MSATFAHMVQELSGILKINHLTMDSQTQCTLNIDGFIVLIQYIAESEQILVACTLGAVPDSDSHGTQETLYRLLLQGQFLFKETAGATLAVDPENTFVVLQLVRSMVELGRDSLYSVLETFLNVAVFWRTRLETETALPTDNSLSDAAVLTSYIKV